MAEENPTVEPIAPEKEPHKEESLTGDEIGALMETLEKAGVRDVKTLEGKLQASQQTGNLANQLGDTRAEITRLTGLLQERESRPAPRRQENLDDFNLDNYGEGQQFTLEDVKKASAESVEEVLTRREQQQAQAQRQVYETWNAIQSDPDYSLVKEVWEAKLKEPDFVYKIGQGLANPLTEYNETVRVFLKGLIKQSHGTINQLRGGPPPVNQPHVETSGSRGQPQNLVNEGGVEETPQQKRQRDMLRRTDKGESFTDDEIIDTFDDVIDAAFNKTG